MQVKVWNDNIHPYKEKFRDQEIYIPAKEHIMMGADEAQIFLGTFNGMIKDTGGAHMAQGFKMLRIEKPVNAKFATIEQDPLKCIACGYVATSKVDLSEHVKFNHADQSIKDEEAEKASADKINAMAEKMDLIMKENEALKAQITSSQTKPRKRKPGPKKSGAVE